MANIDYCIGSCTGIVLGVKLRVSDAIRNTIFLKVEDFLSHKFGTLVTVLLLLLLYVMHLL